jgi:predicted AAA+ superfamily ATPase
MLKNISKIQVFERLKVENPWWVTAAIDTDYSQMPRRLYFDLFRPMVYEQEIRRAVVLMGPRRVGKTVMLYHTIEDLLKNGVSPHKIIFITVENPIYINIGLEQLFNYAKEALGRNETSGYYVFFDEIQYLKNWELHLKTLVDTYRDTKFIVSGSAAAALKFKSTESGAGRFTDFLLPPLTFNEYINMKGLENIMIPSTIQWQQKEVDFYVTSHISELNQHFINYINYGGYPEVIFSEKMQANPGRYIKQDIVDKVLLRDLPSLYGIKDVQELNSLFTTIAFNTANEFSYETLSIQSGVDKKIIKTYIEYLEAAFLIKKIQRIDQSGKRFKREISFKLYLTNPSLFTALFAPIEATDENMGNMVETAIYAQWMHRDWFEPWYARWKDGEVDMVGISEKNLKPIWALEIKWSNRYFDKPKSLKSLLHFCTDNKLDKAIVTSIDKTGTIEQNAVTLQFIPAAVYAYNVGKNTLLKKHNEMM